MPRFKFLLALLLGTSLLFSQISFAQENPYEHPFTDLGGSEWEIAVAFIYTEGIVQGYDDGTFQPEKTINRAELLKIILEAIYGEIPEVSSNCGFSDVESDGWYAKYVCYAKDEGIVEGYSDGTFRPAQEVNFVEALKITELAYGWDVESDPSEWYRDYVETAEAANVIPTSIEEFGESLTRGAMADMISRFIFEGEDNLTEYLELIEETDQWVTYDCLSAVTCPEGEETEEEDDYEVSTGNFELFDPELTYEGAYNGPLFATSEQVGEADWDVHFDNLDRNGINFIVAFFGITVEDIVPGGDDDDEEEEDESTGDEEMLESDGACPEYDDLDPDCEEGDLDFYEGYDFLVEAIDDHPYRVVPFFNPGFGGYEVKPYIGDALTENYSDTLDRLIDVLGAGFIRGFGEVEQYAWNTPPTDSDVLQLVDLASENDLFFMFHPDPGQSDEVEDLIEMYPDTTFYIHMFPEDFDDDESEYIEIINSHDNLYYSVDVDHMLFDEDSSWGLLYKYEDDPVDEAIESFIDDYDSMEDDLMNDALRRYRNLIESCPDKVMWGTEMYNEYGYDEEVFDRMIKFTRNFIAELDESAQEKFAYLNAYELFGEGAVLED